LGTPSGDPVKCTDYWWKQTYVKNGRVNAAIYSYHGYNTYVVYGDIYTKYANSGGENNTVLGFPHSDEMEIGDGIGRYNKFERGYIVWSVQNGAHYFNTNIHTRWLNLGFGNSYLGYPITDETKTPDGAAKYVHFQGGSMYDTVYPWTSDPNISLELRSSPYVVRKQIQTRWKELDWERSRYGYPITSTEGDIGSTMTNKFQGGAIKYTSSGYKYEHPYTKIKFSVTTVTCLTQTSDQIFGKKNDEIWIAGVAFYDDWKTHNIPAIDLGSYNTTSNSRKDMYKTLFTLPIDTPLWPKQFIASLTLIEEDGGNLTGNPNKIYNATVDYVTKTAKDKAKELGVAIGTLAGGPIGGAVGAIVGEITSIAAGKAISKAIGRLDDDPFCTVNTPITVQNVYDGFKNGFKTKYPQYLEVYGNGAQYHVFCEWELTN
jgi:Uncharacterized protein potentially involved in peptidoglycan biosynthesis